MAEEMVHGVVQQDKRKRASVVGANAGLPAFRRGSIGGAGAAAAGASIEESSPAAAARNNKKRASFSEIAQAVSPSSSPPKSSSQALEELALVGREDELLKLGQLLDEALLTADALPSTTSTPLGAVSRRSPSPDGSSRLTPESESREMSSSISGASPPIVTNIRSISAPEVGGDGVGSGGGDGSFHASGAAKSKTHTPPVFVVGSTGMGKSALLSTFREEARIKTPFTLTSSAVAVEATTPYYIWRGIFQKLLSRDFVLQLAELSSRERVEETANATPRRGTGGMREAAELLLGEVADPLRHAVSLPQGRGASRRSRARQAQPPSAASAALSSVGERAFPNAPAAVDTLSEMSAPELSTPRSDGGATPRSEGSSGLTPRSPGRGDSLARTSSK